MKATIEFSLPDDESDFKIAVNASKYLHVLYEMDRLLRGYLKYGCSFATVSEALENVRDHLNRLLEESGLSIFD